MDKLITYDNLRNFAYVFAKYHLSENLPIVSSGGSMGGQSALVYAKYAKRTPIFVKAMQESGQDISFDIVPGRGHGDLTEEMWEKYRQYAMEAIEHAK